MTRDELRGVRLEGLSLERLDLRGLDLAGAAFAGCRLVRCRLNGLVNAEFIGCSLRDCSLDLGAGCAWRDCAFERCRLALFGRAPGALRRRALALRRCARAFLPGLIVLVLIALRGMGRALAASMRLFATTLRPSDPTRLRRRLPALALLALVALAVAAWLLLRPDPSSMTLDQLSLRAAELAASNRPSAAAELYRYIIEQRAPAEDRQSFKFRLIASLVEARRYDEAIAEYREIVDAGAASAEIYLQLGTLIELSRGPQQAREFYAEQLKLATDEQLRGVLSGQLERLNGAMR